MKTKTVLFWSFLVFAIAIPFMAGGAYADDNPVTADEKALLKLERQWADAESRHDAVALNAILDDRFIDTFGGGKPLDKDAFIKAVNQR